MIIEANRVLAEICGIHAGDGWMCSDTNEVGFGTSPKEKQYFDEVLALYGEIFDLKYLRILRRKALEFRFQSKDAQKLLISAGFPKGSKLDKLRVPKFVLQNKECMNRFLRGVMDTDGHAYWRKSVNNYYLVLIWVTTSKSFAEDIIKVLKQLGYHPHISSVRGTTCDCYKRRSLHRVMLIRKEDIKRYLEDISFRNHRRCLQVAKRYKDLKRYSLNVSTTNFLSALHF